MLVDVVVCLKGRRQEIDEFCVKLDAIGTKERERKERGREREEERESRRKKKEKWKERGEEGKERTEEKGRRSRALLLKMVPSPVLSLGKGRSKASL